MNFLNKKVLLALALLGVSGQALGYKWEYNNKTNKYMMVQMVLTGSPKPNHRYRGLISPGMSDAFSWGFPYCYSSIKVTEFKLADFNNFMKSNYEKSQPADDQIGKLRRLSTNSKVDIDFNFLAPCVKKFFDTRIWHTPSIIYSKSDFDTEKVVNAMEALGSSAEKGAQLAATAAAGAPGAAPSIDLGLGALLKSMTGLIVEGIEKGACASRSFDIVGTDIAIPGTTRKESAFILISRAN